MIIFDYFLYMQNKMFNQNRNKMKIDKSALFKVANAIHTAKGNFIQ